MKAETLEAIKEIQEWQAANKPEEKYIPKVSIKEEAKLIDQKYIDLICDLLTNNIDSWEFEYSQRIKLNIKNYVIRVSTGYGYNYFEVVANNSGTTTSIFLYDLPFGTNCRKLAKRSVKYLRNLHELKTLQQENELLSRSLDELRGTI
jgi:hypothetical protein